nr:T-cell receptor gamma [Xenopus laevis]
MQFLPAFVLTFLFKSCSAAIVVQQPYISITKVQSGTARVPCQTTSSMLPIHWYQQKSSQLKRILYYHQEKINYDEGFSNAKFDSEKQTELGFTLIIQNINADDAGTYYCACWDYDAHDIWQKIFGSGTRLIVTNTARSAENPKATILSTSKKVIEKQGQGIYLCLLENFFPDAIQVVWRKGNKDIPSEQGEIKSEKDKDNNDVYSTTSWISVTKDDLGNKFTCHYKHEGISKQENWDEVSVVGSKSSIVVPGGENKVKPCNESSTDNMIYPNPASQRAAYLTYLLLITKSALYGPIMFFIIYRPTKFCF